MKLDYAQRGSDKKCIFKPLCHSVKSILTIEESYSKGKRVNIFTTADGQARKCIILIQKDVAVMVLE